MANVIRLKRASGNDPTASDLVSGEPAVRTDTGELFFKKDDGSIAKVAGAGGGPDFKYLALRNAANNGAASYPNADFTLVRSGTTTALTPTAANTLLVSVNGVIQKPNTGTSTPSEGFALSGSTIKFGANISAAPDFILYQESGGIGEPSDDTVSEVKLKVSNSPINGYFLSAQSGNNGGLTWAAPVATSCTGNSATATALETARTINGTSFDGTANITITAAAGTLTGNTLNSSVTASSLTSLGDLSGLTVTGNMAVDTSTLFVNASTNRVGIGTTSPRTELDLHDGQLSFSHRTDYSIRFYNGNGNNWSSINNPKAADGNVTNHSQLEFRTAVGVAMHMATDGKIGIGTTSPETLQHNRVNTFNDDINKVALTLSNNQSSGVHQYFQNASTGTGVSNGVRIGLGNTDNFLIQHFEAKDIQISTNGTERMRIDSSGNVAIGHTSPTALLHIHGLFKTNSFHFTNGGAGRFISQGFIIGDAFTAGKSSADDRDTIFWNERAFSTVFATNNTERMRIDSSGNVLVGTTDALSKLTVDTDLGVMRSSSDPTINLLLGTTSSITQLYRILIDDSDGDKLQIRDNNTPRITLDSSGNVGIGTTSPSEKLDVSGEIQLTNFLKATGDLLLCADIDNNNSGTAIRFLIDGDSSSDELMRIKSDGNVGIGTTSPSTPLHVSTNTDGTSDLLTLHADADGTNNGIASIKLTGNTGNHAAFIKGGHTTNGDSILTFHTDEHASGINPEERMRIDSSGDVSINDGNLVVASGHGIDFSATSDASGKTSELLDNYEEGTFSPGIAAGTTVTQTFDSQGRYTKIGRQVYVQFLLQYSGAGTSAHFKFNGLPFTALNNSSRGGGTVLWTNIPGLNDKNFISAIVSGDDTTIFLYHGMDSQTSTGSGGFSNRAIYVRVTYEAA